MKLFLLGALIATGIILSSTALATPVASKAATMLPPITDGDEPITLTNHVIQTPTGPLEYEARAGRLPIRNEETGEVRGHVFFVAYVAKHRGANRPLTFAWNGGPTISSILLHTEFLGPRRITKQGFVDNPESLLTQTDLVFYDPIETGFSRPDKPEYAQEFLTMLGDVAVTGEFIRAYRARFNSETQPLFILGESYGVWRACAVSELLTMRGDKLAGVILISGDIPGIPMPLEFHDAMHVYARTALAFSLKRLSADLMRDREATMREVDTWITSVYLPALQALDRLSEADRERIANDLAHFTGVHPYQVDRATLVMSNIDYMTGLFVGDKEKVLNEEDGRLFGNPPKDSEKNNLILRYLRGELGFATDLTYSGLEGGYMPVPGPPRRSTGSRWLYNQSENAPKAAQKTFAARDAKYLASENPAWLERAMRADDALRVFVATGRYDLLNMCEGDVRMTAQLEPALLGRITNRCYEGGHVMYRIESTRQELSRDLATFVETSAHLPRR
jgi:carboxypeptidase C (cathepsin A)